MSTANFESEAVASIEKITKPLLKNSPDLSNRCTHNKDCGLSLLRAWAYRLKRDLDRFGVLAVEVTKSVVDLGHKDLVPLLHDFWRQRHMGI